MSRPAFHARLALAALVTVASACSSDDPVAPAGADAALFNADVAVTTGSGIASDLAVWAGNEAAVPAGFAGAGAPAAGDCIRAGDTVTCTGGREGTLTVRRTVRFLDAAGTTQQQYDATNTASIVFGVNVSGSVLTPQVNATITRTRQHTVSGLAGAETQRTWNGTGGANVQSTFQRRVSSTSTETVTRIHQIVETDTTTNVVWTVAPRAAWPASGTIVRHVVVNTTLSGARTGSFAATRRVRVTFNGTAQVPLEVSSVTRRGTTVALTCQLDLNTRVVSCDEELSH